MSEVRHHYIYVESGNSWGVYKSGRRYKFKDRHKRDEVKKKIEKILEKYKDE